MIVAKTRSFAKARDVPGSTKHATTDRLAVTVLLQVYHCVAVIVLLCCNNCCDNLTANAFPDMLQVCVSVHACLHCCNCDLEVVVLYCCNWLTATVLLCDCIPAAACMYGDSCIHSGIRT